MHQDDEDLTLYRVTPKGALCHAIGQHLGMDGAVSILDDVWNDLQAFCMRRLRDEFPNEEYPAIVFDGHGGVVVGVNITYGPPDEDEENDEDEYPWG